MLDLVGGETGPAARCRRCATAGCFIAVPSASGVEPLREVAGDRVRVTGILVEPDRAGLEALAGLVATGALRVHVDADVPARGGRRARTSWARPAARRASWC